MPGEQKIVRQLEIQDTHLYISALAIIRRLEGTLEPFERELETRTQQWDEAERALAQADAALLRLHEIYHGQNCNDEPNCSFMIGGLAAARQRQEGRG